MSDEYYDDDEEFDEEDEEFEDDEEEFDDPGMIARCADWKDEPENCSFCADDECPLNKS